MWIYLIGALAVLAIVARIGLAIVSRPAAAGVGDDGRLADCPDTPNCVCSYDSDPEHAIEALPLIGGRDGAIDRLQACLRQMPGVSVVKADDRYLHAVSVTPLMRFTDDLELQLDEEAGLIQVRSASRVGHSDLGANRKRVEELRLRWAEYNSQ